MTNPPTTAEIPTGGTPFIGQKKGLNPGKKKLSIISHKVLPVWVKTLDFDTKSVHNFKRQRNTVLLKYPVGKGNFKKAFFQKYVN